MTINQWRRIPQEIIERAFEQNRDALEIARCDTVAAQVEEQDLLLQVSGERGAMVGV